MSEIKTVKYLEIGGLKVTVDETGGIDFVQSKNQQEGRPFLGIRDDVGVCFHKDCWNNIVRYVDKELGLENRKGEK